MPIIPAYYLLHRSEHSYASPHGGKSMMTDLSKESIREMDDACKILSPQRSSQLFHTCPSLDHGPHMHIHSSLNYLDTN